MRTRTLILILIAAMSARSAQASETQYLIYGRGRNTAAINLVVEATKQMANGDLAKAQQSLDTAIQSDPKLWPAYYVRARLFVRKRQWQAALRDANEALRQQSSFLEAALVRADANAGLGHYAESLHDLDTVIRLRPRSEPTLAAALNSRAWFRASCPNPSFRDGKQAIKDATMACKLTRWKEAQMLDTLASAYAETGDFDSAIRYQEQALHAPDANEGTQVLQEHLALFQRRQSVAGSR
jgi:tetratricopeptide (TPR) repeat protein